jgi:sterol 3beta-glucosyltransferase
MSNNHQSITLLTSGTRGDVQPILALAQQLQQDNQAVTILTHAPFRAFVQRYGIAYAELDGDLIALLTQPQWQSALILRGNPVTNLRTSIAYLHTARPIYARMLQSAWRQTAHSSALIATLPTAAFAGQIAQARSIPLTFAFLQPVGRTRMFPSPLLPITRSLGPLNALSHLLIELSLWLPWRAELQHWRSHTLGLAPMPLAGPFTEQPAQQAPRWYGFSPHVVPRPADWPAEWQICGYWFLHEPQPTPLPAALQQFLAAGPAPIYIGFGSMGSDRNPQLLQILEESLRRTGMRAVMAMAAVPGIPGDHYLLAEAIDHTQLLPQMALAVHHGGAGTTAAALRAGIPSVILPVGIDQYFWGWRMHVLGCGPAPVGLQQIRSSQLIVMIEHARSAGVRQQAALLGARIRSS